MKQNVFHWLQTWGLIVGLGLILACSNSNNSLQKNQEIAEKPAAAATAVEKAPVQQEIVLEKEPAVPEKKIEEAAVIETSVGVMVLRFFPDVAPGHVENFKKLARQGFYDGTRFHRVIKGFMIQGGDPNSKDDDVRRWGTGGPGYSIKAEFNNMPHVKGTLSMARSSNPDSAGSQFFICHGRAASLDGQYTVFGELIEGMEVLDKIAAAPVTRSPSGENSLPVTPVTVKSVKIAPLSEFEKST
ncbi:MAG: peptidylprolyl isomerase [Candidatus Hinthialibacter sp.]